MYLLSSQSSNENWSSIPYNLQDLSGRNFRNIDFKISISIVPCPSVKSANDGYYIESCKISNSGIVDGIEHVNLSSTYVGFMLIVDSVLIKPVIEISLKINMISKISWSCGCNKKLRLIRNGVIVIQLFRGTLIVLGNQAEVEGRS